MRVYQNNTQMRTQFRHLNLFVHKIISNRNGGNTMNLRKINAVISLFTTILLLDHTIFYSVWMLSRCTITKDVNAMPWVLVALVVLHAVLSSAMGIMAHKGVEKQKHNVYSKLNMRTMIQRMSGIVILILLIAHVIGAATHFHPQWIHAVLQPLFFVTALAHLAVSGSKAFITLGVGNAKFIKILDTVFPVLCGIIFLAGIAGFYLCLFGGVAA